MHFPSYNSDPLLHVNAVTPFPPPHRLSRYSHSHTQTHRRTRKGAPSLSPPPLSWGPSDSLPLLPPPSSCPSPPIDQPWQAKLQPRSHARILASLRPSRRPTRATDAHRGPASSALSLSSSRYMLLSPSAPRMLTAGMRLLPSRFLPLATCSSLPPHHGCSPRACVFCPLAFFLSLHACVSLRPTDAHRGPACTGTGHPPPPSSTCRRA